jgi:hypothetical protein
MPSTASPADIDVVANAVGVMSISPLTEEDAGPWRHCQWRFAQAYRCAITPRRQAAGGDRACRRWSGRRKPEVITEGVTFLAGPARWVNASSSTSTEEGESYGTAADPIGQE